ncbi:hypothetical protein D3229_00450 [Leucobacter aridicollis]|nr:hypothetical protein [Leucobacter aridicollis]
MGWGAAGSSPGGGRNLRLGVGAGSQPQPQPVASQPPPQPQPQPPPPPPPPPQPQPQRSSLTPPSCVPRRTWVTCAMSHTTCGPRTPTHLRKEHLNG